MFKIILGKRPRNLPGKAPSQINLWWSVRRKFSNDVAIARATSTDFSTQLPVPDNIFLMQEVWFCRDLKHVVTNKNIQLNRICQLTFLKYGIIFCITNRLLFFRVFFCWHFELFKTFIKYFTYNSWINV